MAEAYTLGGLKLTRKELLNLLKASPFLKDAREITGIEGPFDGKINSIYHIKILYEGEEGAEGAEGAEGRAKEGTKEGTEGDSGSNDNKNNNGRYHEVILRARISKAFRYEDIIKEKILYPFLTRELDADTPNLGEKIQKLSNQRTGSYIIEDPKNLPIKVPDLIYYDESKKKIPYIYAIYEYIPGESFYYTLNEDRLNHPERLSSNKYKETFKNLGRILGKFHEIRFDGFYSDIRHIGQPSLRKEWKTLFDQQLKKELSLAQNHNYIKPYIDQIKKFFKEYSWLIEDETKPVLFHNDFQSQNIIIDKSENSNSHVNYEQLKSFKINGIIDFDNWRVGTPAQDFVKMEYWTIQDNGILKEAFFEGYTQIHPGLNLNEFRNKINLYKMLWFILVFNFEMDKIKMNEVNIEVDRRFPSAEKYIDEIKKVLDNYS